MKYILVLLISFDSYAQWKASRILPSGFKYDHYFNSEEKANSWAKKSTKNLGGTYSVKNISSDIEKENKRRSEISQIKSALNKIDESDKPLWEKRLLKRLVKELK